jgi:hypothetical protein
MAIEQRIKDVIAEYPLAREAIANLARLQEFLDRMKQAGLIRRREYDLPLPDTLGRSFVPKPRSINESHPHQ